MLDRRLAGLRGGANPCIPSIDYELVEELVESRVEGDTAVNKLPGIWVKNPAPFLVRLAATDIRIRQLQDVLTVRKLLVVRSGGHFFGGLGSRGDSTVNFKAIDL